MIAFYVFTHLRRTIYQFHANALSICMSLTGEEDVEEGHDEGHEVDDGVAGGPEVGDEGGAHEGGHVGRQVGQVVDRLQLQQLAERHHQPQLAVPE